MKIKKSNSEFVGWLKENWPIILIILLIIFLIIKAKP